jgi:hypothetical protein
LQLNVTYCNNSTGNKNTQGFQLGGMQLDATCDSAVITMPFSEQQIVQEMPYKSPKKAITLPLSEQQVVQEMPYKSPKKAITMPLSEQQIVQEMPQITKKSDSITAKTERGPTMMNK